MNNNYSALIGAMKENALRIEEALDSACYSEDKDISVVVEAERYSLLGAGKRIRPFLVCEVCNVLGGDERCAIPLATALEMIHTYSLIHDDLPCMDDDDIRRGKLSCHKAFGYANALLAGDALLTGAFGVIAKDKNLDDSSKVKAIEALSEYAGHSGMIGGQVIDLESEEKSIDMDKLLKLHSMKTGALIRCAVMLGVIASGRESDKELCISLCDYASKIGLAFQVIDDVLDVISSEEELGKKIGSDKENGKTTFLSFYSVEDAIEYAKRLTDEAVIALRGIENAQSLSDLAYFLLERKK